MGALDWALASPLRGLPLVGSETEEVRSAFKYIFSFSLTEGGLLIEDAETLRRQKQEGIEEAENAEKPLEFSASRPRRWKVFALVGGSRTGAALQ